MSNPRRRLALIALTAVFIVAGAAAALWWWLDGRWHTSTDDAYVQGNLVQLTPQIAGIVIRINADDTALVREGDPVVVLDAADTQTALDEAKAGLAQAVRRVRQLYANTDALRASVELRRAESGRASARRIRGDGVANDGGNPSRRQAGGSEAARVVSRGAAGVGARAGHRLRGEAQRATRRAGRTRRAAAGHRAARGRLGRRELQGNAARIRPHRPAGHAYLRPVRRRSHVSRHRYRARVGHG